MKLSLTVGGPTHGAVLTTLHAKETDEGALTFDMQLVACILAYGDVRLLVGGDGAAASQEEEADRSVLFVALVRHVIELSKDDGGGAVPFAASIAHLIARLTMARCFEHAGTIVMHTRQVHPRMRTESAARFALKAFLTSYAEEDEEEGAGSGGASAAATNSGEQDDGELRRRVCGAALRRVAEGW